MPRSGFPENDIVQSAQKYVGVHKRTVSDYANTNDFTFDGDTLNILLIINKEFARAASLAFNPRNAMHISKNDGMFDNAYNQQRDTIINLNTFVQIGRENYSQEQLDAIQRAQAGA